LVRSRGCGRSGAGWVRW